MEVVSSQAERGELSTHCQSCRDASLQRVDAEVEHPQPAEAAELRRYRAGEAVVAEVERPEERQVAEERRDTASQTHRVDGQRNDPPGVPPAARHPAPGAQASGRVP